MAEARSANPLSATELKAKFTEAVTPVQGFAVELSSSPLAADIGLNDGFQAVCAYY